MAPWTPAMIDRLDAALSGAYRVEREIGRGGMATVYLAEDLRHDRQVALKVLSPELAAAVPTDRFLHEIRTTANLQHPHILPLFDSGEADGLPYYVMPYVEGESLRDRLDREGQLPVADAVEIAVQIADALDYAHRQGVVHRDIKPANILLLDGKAVLADFGIALADGGAGLTETGLSVGTPLYMSPEQATGNRYVGPPTDLYALGAVLYEMLIGDPPHTGSTAQAVIARIMAGSVEAPRKHRPTVPENVDAAARKALERVPADRFPTGRAFAEALSDPGFRHGESGDAVTGASGWRKAAAAGWAVALVLALGLGWSLLRPGGEGDGPSVRYGSIVFPEGTRSPGNVKQPIAISPDGRRVAYVVERDGGRELHTRLLSEPSGTRVEGTGPAVGSITFSPDGGSIAYHDIAAHELRRVPVDGGPVETLASIPPGGMGFDGLAWSSDGTVVFSAENRLMTVSESGGTPRPLTSVKPEEGMRHTTPSVLPDGSGVVFAIVGLAYPWHSRIAVLRFGEEEPVVLADGHSPAITPAGVLVFGRGFREGSVWAVALTDDLTASAGEPVRVLSRLGTSQRRSGRQVYFQLAANGTMVHLPPETTISDALVWVDRQGEMQSILRLDDDQLPPELQSLVAPRVSPAGDRIAFRGAGSASNPNFRLFVFDLERTVVSSIRVDANADWPVWTPDGHRLVFNRFTEGEHNLYWTRADGAGEPEPFEPPNARQQHALDFTSDGARLIVQSREYTQAPNSDIVALPVDGVGPRRPIVAGPDFEHHASLSPDGGWLAYVSDVSGRREVYVTDFPDALTRTKISTESGFSPVWNPRGGELFYRRTGDGAMMAVSVSTDSTLRAGIPRLLFEGRFSTCCVWGRSFDVSPDGERFLMIRVTDEALAVPRVEVVHGWMADVERRVRG